MRRCFQISQLLYIHSLNARKGSEMRAFLFYSIIAYFHLRYAGSRWKMNGAICEAKFRVRDCGSASDETRRNAKIEREMREKSSVSDERSVRRSFVRWNCIGTARG